jgi:hypothetical protein
MAAVKKTPIHKHTHPAYAWIALIVCSAVVMSLAGWYYLTITQGYNDEVLNTVQEMTIPAGQETASANTVAPIDITTETISIDTDVNSANETDFADTQLDDTILGIQK